MAAAKPPAHNTLHPFGGTADKKWSEFESLLRSFMNVGKIPNANRPQFFPLHLLNQALKFFKIQSQATRDDFHAAITTPRSHYCNTKLHKLRLHNLKFEHKNGSPENLLVNMQIKATQAYPDPVFPPIPAADPPNNQAKIQNAKDSNQATLDNAVNE